MDYEANRKELANRLVEVQFAPVEGGTPLQDNDSTTSFPLGKIAEYGEELHLSSKLFKA